MVKVTRSVCVLCQIGCGILVHSDNGQVVKVEGDPESPLNKGILCPKGLASLEYFYHPDRLKQPLKRLGKRGGGKWAPISWDEALDIVARELIKAKDKYGPESVTFVRGSAKGGWVSRINIVRFANVFGSPNTGHQGHVCFVPRRNASRITYGSYAVPDLEYPPASIVIWGKNLEANLHHVHWRVMRAVERGAKLMVIDPRNIGGAHTADLWLKPRPGSDLALALGMINVIINEGLYDKAFVEHWTVGFQELKTHIQDYTPERVATITWIPADMIRHAARFYGVNKPACLQWGNAIDHGVNSFQTARALCILRAISGNLDAPGGDVRWSRPTLVEQSSPELTLSIKISAEVRKRALSSGKQLPTNSDVQPQDIVKAILHEDPYPVRAAYLQGCNALLSYSNARETYQALLKLDFLVVVDMFMTPTAALADIVLPAATYLEYDDMVVPAFSMPVALVQQKVTRIGECRSDYEILRDLARKMGLGEHFWDTEEQCLDFILRPSGISFDEFKKIGFLLGSKRYRSYQSNGFSTPSGKVELYSSQLEKWGFDPLPIYYEQPETSFSAPELAEGYPLVVTSGKRGCYRHSAGRQIASLRGGHPEPVVSIHPETAKGLGIADGDWVYIETKRGKIKQKASLSPDIDPRVVIVDYAWWFPEDGPDELYGWAKSNINILTDDQPPFNREMGSTVLRGIVCKVSKAY